jgi:nucleoside-diphosphate-sugar epimerase
VTSAPPDTLAGMSRIAVVGGHGKVALQLHPLLVEAGHTPVALVRKEEYRTELEAAGAEVRLLDIEDQHADGFAEAFAGCEAVVFAAGGGPDGNIDRKRTVDLEGSLKSIAAAQTSGIRRFVQVSAIGVDGELPDDTQEVWRAYVEAKRGADHALRESDLDWTILRPGRLTDDPATGLVQLGREGEGGDVTRADVAAVIVAVLDDERAVGQQWDLVNGETPVADAVAAATENSQRD